GGSSERTARRNDRSPDRDQGRVRFSSADSKKLPFSTIDSGVLRNNFVNKIDPEKGVCFVRNNTSACIEVQIVNKVVLAVADSGAQASLINLSLVKDLALEPCYIKLCDVNGNPIRVEGQIELELIVGDKSLRHTFIAADVG